MPTGLTTGGKPKLLGISKRGNIYLRTLLIHGASATMHTLAKSQTTLGGWLRKLLARAHYNVVVVALANKLAKLTWATLRRDVDHAFQFLQRIARIRQLLRMIRQIEKPQLLHHRLLSGQ